MRQVATFIAVGSAAALTHLATVALLVEAAGLKPIAANAIGFVAAFFVSFTGHSRWTFPISSDRIASTRRRFLAVAFTGFVINQVAYAEALHLVGPNYYLAALGAVLAGVAVSTFVLSKLWAFAEPQT